MAWEVNWNHPENTGTMVLARNLSGHSKSSRVWHMTATGYLRDHSDLKMPTYRKDSWEVDWSKRNGKLVWAKNQNSKMPTARDWHWVDFHTIERSGIEWKPSTEFTGRHIDSRGYVNLTKRGMTKDEIEIANKFNLFRGSRKTFVREHQLVAVKKYGYLPDVVRHINGIKTDNRPDNLVGGTTQENTMDHNTARLKAMYWRNKYEELLASIK